MSGDNKLEFKFCVNCGTKIPKNLGIISKKLDVWYRCPKCGRPVSDKEGIEQWEKVRAQRQVQNCQQEAQREAQRLAALKGICAGCGLKLPVKARVCSRCGRPVSDEKGIKKWEEAKAQWEADMKRIHSAEFYSQRDYENWLKQVGTNIEIIDTTDSKHYGLLSRYDALTVTYKMRYPQTSQPHQPQQTIPTNIPGQIRQLAKLKEEGILTEEEFQTKKRELLSKM